MPATSSAATPIDFGALLDASPHAYVALTPDLSIAWANRAYLDVTGRNLSSLQGQSIFDAFPSGPHDPGGASQRQLRESLERVQQRREPDTLALIRYAIPRAARHAADASTRDDGYAERYWSATHTPVFDADGKLAFILQQTDDISDLQRIRQDDARGIEPSGQVARVEADTFRRAQDVQARNSRLDAERSHLRRLFDQAPAFVAFMRGPQHVFELVNDAFMQLVGNRDVLGKPVREAMPEIAEQAFIAELDRVYATARAHVDRGAVIHLQRRPDAEPEEIVVDFVYQPIIENDDSISGIFAIGTDISEYTRNQRELQRYRDQLQVLVHERTRALELSESERQQAETALRQAQKMEAIGQLTGGIAHDFNNLLQVIGGNLQLLQNGVAGDADVRRLNAAMSAVERGARVASQLLSFARRQPLEPRAVNLGSLVRGMDDLLRRAIGEAIEIETVISGGLWTTLADPDRVENAILNLALNARDAMGGAGRLTIEASNAMLDEHYALQHSDLEPGQYVLLAVSDTGGGMSAEVMEKAFEPFFSTKPDGHGTGLGLSMVYGFVKQSGGHVKLYSEAGSGTTVKIYLPRAHVSEEQRIPVDAGPIEGGVETILVVEDDPSVQATVVDLLKDLGYRVLKASDAQSALIVVHSGVPIDLLFTDVVMPGTIRAPELARRVRDALPDVAVLFTSGYTENAIVHGGRLDLGISLLSKPYRREDLARRVRHVLRNRLTYSEPESMQPPLGKEPNPSPVLRLLFVEDDAMIRTITEDMLCSRGHHVVAVGDAKSALAALEQSAHAPFDVLFTDINLPRMSGISLAAEARRLQPQLPVIFASGYGRAGAGDLSPELQNAVFLQKPYAVEDIERALREVSALG